MAIILLTALLKIFVDYKQYTRVLGFLTLSLFAYVVFVLEQYWGQALRNTIPPPVQFNQGYLLNIVAVLGTTISPHLFFWQANQ